MSDVVLTVAEAADTLRMDISDVAELIDEGRLQAFKLVAGGPLLVRAEDLPALVETLAEPAVPPVLARAVESFDLWHSKGKIQ